MKWAQAHNDESSSSLGNYDSFLKQSDKRSESPTKNSASHYYSRRKHIQVLSSLGFHKPTDESLNSMKNYHLESKKGELPFNVLEKNWYGDLINVGQRLKLLRDGFKVIQMVRKKKALGLKVDFRPAYDTKVSRNESPAHLDDESRPSKTDDEDEYKVREYPPPTRRGRPRKKRGRERKPTVGRGDARSTTATRTRVSRRQLDRSALPQASTPRRNAAERGSTPLSLSSAGPLTSIKTEQMLALSPPQALQLLLNQDSTLRNLHVFGSIQPTLVPEPQGPPLMYLPPILPSQRHHLIHGIPPYRHMKEIEDGMSLGGAAVDAITHNHPMKEPMDSSDNYHTPADSSMVELKPRDDATLKANDLRGPEAAELSNVFKQLAEGQAHLSPQSNTRIPYAANASADDANHGDLKLAAAQQGPVYNQDSSSQIQILTSDRTMSGTSEMQNTTANYENMTSEITNDTSFNANWETPKQSQSTQSNSISDRSFINRLLN